MLGISSKANSHWFLRPGIAFFLFFAEICCGEWTLLALVEAETVVDVVEGVSQLGQARLCTGLETSKRRRRGVGKSGPLSVKIFTSIPSASCASSNGPKNPSFSSVYLHPRFSGGWANTCVEEQPWCLSVGL